jgi:hypothetical protein
VHDRPRRQQDDRPLALAVDLVEDLDAVALDVALGVGVAGARLLALGAQAGEARIREVVEGAGFTTFRRVAETPFNMVFEARP